MQSRPIDFRKEISDLLSTMVRKCVAYGCSSSNKDGVSLHEWPKDDKIGKRWTNFVQTKRACWTHTKQSTVLCSKHFKEDCFAINKVQESMGFGSKKRKLHIWAVPTIHSHQIAKEAPTMRPGYAKRERSRILQEIEKNPFLGNDSLIGDIGEPEVPTDSCYSEENNHPAPLKVQSTGTVTDICTKVHKSVEVKPRTRNVQLQAKSKGCSKGLQVGPKTEDKSIQCELIVPLVTSSPIPSDDEEEDMSIETNSDVSYCPTSEELEEEEESDSDLEADITYELANQQAKFVVFLNMLLSLFRICHLCGQKGAKAVTKVVGTFLEVRQTCRLCEESFIWKSQPYIGSIPAGNLLLSSSILFSGATPSKVLRCLQFWGVSSISRTTYFAHQKTYLHKVINNIWRSQQEQLLTSAKSEPPVVAGDARCDSMGHSAKYGSYSLMDTNKCKIIAMELIQSNETGGSYGMELEGLKRCLEDLKEAGVFPHTIVTDRHLQIQKWLRESCPDIVHFFDIWHVAKGLNKKLQALGKKNGFSLVSKWTRSIVNHLYWCAITSEGDGELALAKWGSVTNHISNIHTGHNDRFPTCLHDHNLNKEWFSPGTPDFEHLSDILESSYLRKDVKKLSPISQTSSLEGFHSVVNHFAPKMFHFGYEAMRSRLRLAAMHFNENAQRPQAENSNGGLQFAIAFPKAKQGHYSVRKITEACTYSYIDQLFDELEAVSINKESGQESNEVVPPPLCQQYQRPNKPEAVAARFSYIDQLFDELEAVSINKESGQESNEVVPPPLCQQYQRPNKPEAVAARFSRFIH